MIACRLRLIYGTTGNYYLFTYLLSYMRLIRVKLYNYNVTRVLYNIYHLR